MFKMNMQKNIPHIVKTHARQNLSIYFIVIFLFLIPGYIYLKYTSYSYESYTSGSGLDVQSDCKIQPEISTTIKISKYSLNTWVDIGILNYKEINDGCSFFKFIIPGEIANFGIQLPNETPLTPETMGYNWEPKWKRIEYMYRSPFRYDVVTIRKKEHPEFIGIASYIWVNRLEKISYSERRLKVPFFAPIDGNDKTNYTEIKKSQLMISTPSDAVIRDMSHPMSNRKMITTYALNWFDIDRENSVFEATIKFDDLAGHQTLMVNLSLLLLGAGLALLIERIVGALRKYQKVDKHT